MATPQFDKLPLENALDESPQVHSLVGIFEEDADALKDYIVTLHQIASRLVAAHNVVTNVYHDLARHLKAYNSIKFPVDSDPEGILYNGLNQFVNITSEMSSWQHIVATQIADGVVYPLSRYIDTDLQEVQSLTSMYQNTTLDVEKTIERYSKSKRRDNQKLSDALYLSKKRYHQTSLHHYAKLNQLQTSRKTALLEPLLGLVAATRAHHRLATDSLSNGDTDMFLSGIGTLVKGLQELQTKEKEENLELIEAMVAQSVLSYYPQPPSELAKLPPDTTLASKSGYLNVMRKYMGVMSSWERQHIFLEGGNLMGVPKGELAGSLILELDPSTLAHATDQEDRPHVFQVSTAKRTVTLQALNDRERDEWMITIQNVAQEGGYVKDNNQTTPGSATSSILSGVGSFIADKIQAAVGGNTSISNPTSPQTASGGAPSSPTMKNGIFSQDAPIEFDLLSGILGLEDGFGFDEKDSKSSLDLEGEGSSSFHVRFLGCMEVKVHTVDSFLIGQSVIFEVMRRILAARAIHNVFSTSELELVISATKCSIILCDINDKTPRLVHDLASVSYWAAHTENHKLFGYIVRQHDLTSENDEDDVHSCYVFEVESSVAKDVCFVLGNVSKAVYASLFDLKCEEEKRKKETRLLLENIASLPDKEDIPIMSADGHYLVLDDDSPASLPSSPPTARAEPNRLPSQSEDSVEAPVPESDA